MPADTRGVYNWPLGAAARRSISLMTDSAIAAKVFLQLAVILLTCRAIGLLTSLGSLPTLLAPAPAEAVCVKPNMEVARVDLVAGNNTATIFLRPASTAAQVNAVPTPRRRAAVATPTL